MEKNIKFKMMYSNRDHASLIIFYFHAFVINFISQSYNKTGNKNI